MKNLWIGLIAVISITACNNTPSENSTDSTVVEDGPYGLVLDDGDLWLANPETTAGVKNMQQIVEDYKSRNQSPSITMGDSLQEQLNTIFAECTMKGEAHNQLHNYLLPLLDLVDGVKDQEVTADQYSALNEHLNLYFDYFK